MDNICTEETALLLLHWYDRSKRELPWRIDHDPYRVWVSEIMLQQTRVEAVIFYYERFLRRFPDVFALANAPEEDVVKAWEGLGYYNRVRNMQKAARSIAAGGGRSRGTLPNCRNCRDLENILPEQSLRSPLICRCPRWTGMFCAFCHA